jgi:hypothetical protein
MFESGMHRRLDVSVNVGTDFEYPFSFLNHVKLVLLSAALHGRGGGVSWWLIDLVCHIETSCIRDNRNVFLCV